MFMDPIAVMRQYPMTIIWITYTMGIYITNMTIIGTNALLKDASSTPNTNTNMAPIVVTLPSPMAITSIIYTTDTYTPPMATTGTNTNPVILVSF
jgi:hypothetical protein